MSEEINEVQENGGARRSGGLSFVKLFILLAIIVVIIVAGYFVAKKFGGSVAVVNGQAISRTVYDRRYGELAATVTAQGQSATSTEMQSAIKAQTLEDLINETLLLQSAEKEGIKANQTSVDAAYNQSKNQFTNPDDYEKALKSQGLTDGTFKETLTKNNIIQQYLAAHVDVSSATASDREIQELYDQVASVNKTVPPLKDVRSEVENQIVSQKQKALIVTFINQLKASSTIERLIK